ncbi:MAG: protein translocase subunit SecDF [Bacteroidia bacterium]|nr:protein translocase subunit SecDF [Bacteroidia bacterium]
MQNKGLIRLFTALLFLVCLFYLSFTWIVVGIEDDAKTAGVSYSNRSDIKTAAGTYAGGDQKKADRYLDSVQKARTGRYLDSLKNQEVYLGFTYLDCKEKEINFGLDLKGGMNVTLEISVPDLIKGMSSRQDDPVLLKALENARKAEKTDARDFATLFGEELKKLDTKNNISFYFRTIELKGKVDANTKDEDVLALIRETVTNSIKTAETTLRARIDRFGVTQPNIQKLEASGRILIELPGVTEKERVRKLLQGSANLEFWETFSNRGDINKKDGIFFKLVDANVELKNILHPELSTKDSTAADTGKVTAPDTTKSVTAKKEDSKNPDSLKQPDTNALASLLSTDTTNKDSGTMSRADSLELMRKENPLFSIMLYSLDDKNEPAEGPIIGYASPNDTSKIMSYFRMERVSRLFPSNIKFLWGKENKKGTGILPLYAIKITDRNGNAALSGDIITKAKVDFDQGGGGYASVTMNMTTEAASQWSVITKSNIGSEIAIVLDNIVYSAPTVQNQISGGSSSITGNFTIREAEDLANILSAGKLPAAANIVEESIVGPTLGAEAMRKGFLSFVIALLLILFFMVIYYNKAGMVADIALFANMFFIVGVLASYGAVLTLPGIAGIVLVIGLSVDANVLIFERIREELSQGKGQSLAIKDGFKGALSSILDSNITTIILGIILAAYGTGPVQGFAITLIIGILSSLFCALFITRLIFEAMDRRKMDITFWNNLSKGVLKGVNINFVGNRKYFYILSALIIATGVFMYAKKGGFNLGVDFEGGRSYVIRFEQPVPTENLISPLTASFDGEKPEIKTYGEDNQLRITTSYLISDPSKEASVNVEKKLEEGIGKVVPGFILEDHLESQTKVGETISRDIRNASVLTIIFSCAVMFLYILLRFKKWQYGLGATVALFHDVAVVLACYLIFDGLLPFALEIDQHFVAAILTVMGYSMTDTVVVFDRIREFLSGGKKDEAGEERKKLINYALNATLSRTLITSLTTFIVLVAIFVFGGEVIRGFSFALLIGIVIGTYSSLCIATPVVIDFDRKKKE